MPTAHRLGDQVARQATGDVRSHRRRKEEPRVGTIAGAGSFDRNRHANRAAGLAEGADILLPGTLVKVGCDEPARFVFEKRVDANDVPPLEVIEDYLITHGHECLMGAVAAPSSGLERAEPRLPFVCARWSETGLASLFADEPGRKDVGAPPEQRSEQLHLVVPRARCHAVRRERQAERHRSQGSGRCRGRRKLGPKQRDPSARLRVRPLDLRESLFFSCELLQDDVPRLGHIDIRGVPGQCVPPF